MFNVPNGVTSQRRRISYVPAFFVNGEQDCGLFSTQCYTVSNYLISNGFAKGYVLASKRWPFALRKVAFWKPKHGILHYTCCRGGWAEG